MTYSKFLDECCNLPTDENLVLQFTISSVNNLSKQKFDEKEIVRFCKENIESLSTIAPGVIKCITACNKIEALVNSKDVKTTPVHIVKNNFIKICEIIETVTKQDEEENLKKNQNESNIQTIVISYEEKFKEIQDKMQKLEDNMRERLELADSKIENRTVSVLMNTISILSLFVAIAFAGFGTLTIFREITLDFVNEYFKGITLLAIIAFLTYNLILILLYFVCKVSINDDRNKATKLFGWNFFKSLLFWIDIVLLGLIIVLLYLISNKLVV